jgi:hypothetical protein
MVMPTAEWLINNTRIVSSFYERLFWNWNIYLKGTQQTWNVQQLCINMFNVYYIYKHQKKKCPRTKSICSLKTVYLIIFHHLYIHDISSNNVFGSDISKSNISKSNISKSDISKSDILEFCSGTVWGMLVCCPGTCSGTAREMLVSYSGTCSGTAREMFVSCSGTRSSTAREMLLERCWLAAQVPVRALREGCWFSVLVSVRFEWTRSQIH